VPARKRSRPFVQFEHGTRVYAPTPDSPRCRVITVDAVTGKRHYFKRMLYADSRDGSSWTRGPHVKRHVAGSNPAGRW